MTSLIKCSGNLRVLAAALLLVAGCAARVNETAAPDGRGPVLAVLPVQNLTGNAVPAADIRNRLQIRLHEQGLQVLDNAVLEAFLEKNRIRFTSGVDPDVSKTFKEQAGVDAVLITSCELYNGNSSSSENGGKAKVSLAARLVTTGPEPRLAWADSVGMSGDDPAGLLGIGSVESPAILLEQAADRLSSSLAQQLKRQGRPGKTGNRDLQPETVFRSPVVGLDLRENTVGFLLKGSIGDEGSGTVQIPVLLNARTMRPVTVEYAVTGGTASGRGMDYALREGTLTFARGETAKTIELEVVDDGLHEEDETVEVSLRNAKNAVLGEIAKHTYTIADNDPLPSVRFTPAVRSVGEGAGSVTVTVELSSLTGQDVMVPFTTGGTAAAEADYRVLTPGPLVIKAGQRSAAIEIAVIDDRVNEPAETIELAMGVPVNAVQGAAAASTVTITDNDPEPSVAFSLKGSRGEESATPARVEAVLSSASGKTVTVDYGVTGGTASANADFVLPNGTLTFEPGETVKTIGLEVVDDSLHEGDETVEVSLGNAKNATAGGTITHVYTIKDNDPMPAVGFREPTRRGDEAIDPARLAVVLSGASARPVTVEYAVTGGTASGRGADYALREGSLTFGPGETAKTIELEVVDDGLHEEDETVEVSLRNAKNAALGEIAAHTYAIADNDPLPSVRFTPSARSVGEGAGSVTVTVELSAVTGQDVVVPFTTGGTAVPEADYRMLTPGPLVIKAGSRSAAITIELLRRPSPERERTIELAMGDVQNALPGALHLLRLNVQNQQRKPVLAVLPFFNASSRANAGEIVMLHFLHAMQGLSRFAVLEPGVVRRQLLNLRFVMDIGMSLSDADLVFDALDADLILCGRVLEYQDYSYSAAAPKVEFMVELIERRSRKIVWSSRSYHQGDEDILLFDWGRVNTASELAGDMVRTVVKRIVTE